MELVPYAALAAAYLIKLDQGLATVSALRRYLVEQPALVWLCGFQLTQSWRYPWGFDVDASLPTARHLTRMLRTTPAPAPSRRRGAGVPNDALQRLLDSSVELIGQELAVEDIRLGESISLDTKHTPALAAQVQVSWPGLKRTTPRPTCPTVATTSSANPRATQTAG